MNKNLFKTFAIAAMAVLAGACAKEQVGSADGETVEMTFNVDVPETTITTKGLSDAAQVNELVFQVFLRGAKDQNKHYIYIHSSSRIDTDSTCGRQEGYS